MKNRRSIEEDLAPWATPDESPWADRCHPERGGDFRGSYQRDRDRIIHCASFRKLQHKTQVLVVHEGDYFRTRLNHSIEVTQIGRTLACWLKLTEPLVEAICLGHDLGHVPFGHAGEHEFQRILAKDGLEWNSNVHSLTVVEELEIQYPNARGLNLTWATREGLARHRTKHDIPGEDERYGTYRQPSLEAQVANVADAIAYNTHDVEDALLARLLEEEQLHGLSIRIWEDSWQQAKDEFNEAHPGGYWLGVDDDRLLNIRRAHRHLIDCLITDVRYEALRRCSCHNVTTIAEARDLEEPIVAFSKEVAPQVESLQKFMMNEVYKGDVVARQNYRAGHILRELFRALLSDPKLLPSSVHQQLKKKGGSPPPLEIARFLSGLTDRGAADLYAELFEPTERAMGHRIV